MTGEKECPVPKATDTFILGELIGTGSFSNVYKATIKGDDDSIAIKAFKLHKKDGKAFERAAAEMAFLQILDHDNIIQFILCNLNREYMYLGMEYSEFGSITKVMANGELYSEKIVQGIMNQIMAALNYLHGRYILHGDVKPGNIIIIKPDPYVIKLSDFGLAEVLVDPVPCVKKMGSFYYMAPEIHLGFPADLTADLYSAGVVMYELLFGRTPFLLKSTREAFTTVLRKRTSVSYAPNVYMGLSQECKDFMRDMLSYEKYKRPLGEALKQYPFIRLEENRSRSIDYYKKGCDTLTEAIGLVESKQFGPACISLTHAILLLEIYARSVFEDEGLYAYMCDRLIQYRQFNKEIEKRLLSKDDREPLYMPLNNEHLRCMLTTTPTLANAFDLCLVGEMYVRQQSIQTGGRMLRSGLDKLFTNLRLEPDSERKGLLFAKYRSLHFAFQQKVVHLVAHIHRHLLNRISSFIDLIRIVHLVSVNNQW
ncbi:unnamed protein product [Phaedon cochleariae]|uniref:Protein kinase domain-containing protein n=1 Tax=Phaedon cochleariae TaxID=80249 RepID=A0A9N9SCA0_PHACE|nr:unnamed protein product [Phaedon cochleariae]